MARTLTCYGAAQTVTGSRHLLEVNGKRILVDCGMFQGPSEVRARNWLPFNVPPSDIDAVVLTHAHMDHIGFLPRLMRDGYTGPIYATGATVALAKISLPDSGRLQEEEARHANKHGYTKHAPALPLYTERDAYAVLKQMKKVPYRSFFPLPGGLQWQFLPAGHIMGSAFAEIYFEEGDRILMSGDLGRYNTPIIKDPEPCDFAEYLMIESTYGDRLHDRENTRETLAQVLQDAFQDGSCVIVPSFAIGRTQELLYLIHELQDAGECPRIPIYIDSPMAVSTTDVYREALDEHDEDFRAEISEGHLPLDPAGVQFVRDRNQSKALNSTPGPMVIIAGSGMANGGRVVHHLYHRLRDPRTRVVFTGYQAEGTLGRRLIEGEPTVRIFGQEVEVHAQVETLNGLSAHADQSEMLQWLSGFRTPPKMTYIVHGEPRAQEALQAKIAAELGWNTTIAIDSRTYPLS